MTICSVSVCDKPSHTRGFCKGHYKRLQDDRELETPLQSKRAHGSGRIDKNGYVVVKRKGNTYHQHRIIMGELIGRSLTSQESVHHKNGDRADNRPENLELWSSHQPRGQRVEDKIAWAKEILALYCPTE